MNLRTATSIILLFISLTVWAQSFNSGETPQHFYTEIKYEWIKEKIILPVEIEGKKYRFILDTGAPVVIFDRLQKQVNFEVIKKIEVRDANNKTDSLEMLLIPSIIIGGINYQNTPSILTNSKTDSIFECMNVDGFIGSNLLRNSIVQILPQEQIIKLTDRKNKLHLKRKNSTEIRFLDQQSTPYFIAEFMANSKVRWAQYLDTGMSGFYDLSNGHFNRLNENRIIDIKNKGIGSTSIGLYGSLDSCEQYQVEIPEIRINKVVIKNAILQTTNFNNSRIGSAILKYGNITIDYIHKRFYFTSFSDIIDMKEKTFGFKPIYSDGKFIVGIVWDDNLKEELHYGDHIIQINEIDLKNFSLCDYVNLDFDNENQLNLIVINSNGEKKEITIDKKYR